MQRGSARIKLLVDPVNSFFFVHLEYHPYPRCETQKKLQRSLGEKILLKIHS